MAVHSRRNGRRRRRRSPAIEHWLLAGFALAVLLAWLASWPRRPPSAARPPEALSASQARAANAAIPFAPGPVRAAAPYRFAGTPAAREQAVRCLATAALYEAGNAPDGQRAVMQVVLNRLRRPGYPRTVCGVVYQGALLPTGCQFSFACDGSATRRTEHAGWAEARARASRALSGAVFRPVGMATHYHADYVVPYWIGSLAKTATIRSHIFYRPRAPEDGNPALPAGVAPVP